MKPIPAIIAVSMCNRKSPKKQNRKNEGIMKPEKSPFIDLHSRKDKKVDAKQKRDCQA